MSSEGGFLLLVLASCSLGCLWLIFYEELCMRILSGFSLMAAFGQMRTLVSGFPKRPFAQLRLKCIIDA